MCSGVAPTLSPGARLRDMRAKKGASSSPYAFQVYHNLQFLWDKLAHCGCTRSPWNWAVALNVRVSGGSLKGEFEQNYDRTLRPECAAKLVNKSLRATFLPSFLTATGHFLASFLPRKGKSKRFLGCQTDCLAVSRHAKRTEGFGQKLT